MEDNSEALKTSVARKKDRLLIIGIDAACHSLEGQTETTYFGRQFLMPWMQRVADSASEQIDDLKRALFLETMLYKKLDRLGQKHLIYHVKKSRAVKSDSLPSKITCRMCLGKTSHRTHEYGKHCEKVFDHFPSGEDLSGKDSKSFDRATMAEYASNMQLKKQKLWMSPSNWSRAKREKRRLSAFTWCLFEEWRIRKQVKEKLKMKMLNVDEVNVNAVESFVYALAPTMESYQKEYEKLAHWGNFLLKTDTSEEEQKYVRNMFAALSFEKAAVIPPVIPVYIDEAMHIDPSEKYKPLEQDSESWDMNISSSDIDDMLKATMYMDMDIDDTPRPKAPRPKAPKAPKKTVLGKRSLPESGSSRKKPKRMLSEIDDIDASMPKEAVLGKRNRSNRLNANTSNRKKMLRI